MRNCFESFLQLQKIIYQQFILSIKFSITLLGNFSCGTSLLVFLVNASYQENTLIVLLNRIDFMLYKRDTRQGPKYGFTSLMYCVLYNRTDIIHLFRQEVYIKTIQKNIININDESIEVPKGSTIFHIAILTKNLNVIKEVINIYNNCAHNTDYSSLFYPNSDGKTNINYIVDSDSQMIASLLFDLQYQPPVEFQNQNYNIFKYILNNYNLQLILLRYLSTCARSFKTSEVLQEILQNHTVEIYSILNNQIRASSSCIKQLEEVRNIIDNLTLGKAKVYGCQQLVDDNTFDIEQYGVALRNNTSVSTVQLNNSPGEQNSDFSQVQIRASIHGNLQPLIQPEHNRQKSTTNDMHRVISINQYTKPKEMIQKTASEDTVYSCMSKPVSYYNLQNVIGLSESQSQQ